MKKRIIALFSILIFGLSSCDRGTKRTNIILTGHYIGYDLISESIPCELFVEQISEEEYLAANGKNVIMDAVSYDYFSLEFNIFFSDDDIYQVDFYNFVDAYDGATGTPISYIDDNRWWLTPQTVSSNKIAPVDERYYNVENFNICEFFGCVYYVEN